MRVGHPDIEIEVDDAGRADAGAVRPPADLPGADQIIKNATEAIEAVPRGGAGKGRIEVVAARDEDDIVIDVDRQWHRAARRRTATGCSSPM